MNVIDAAYLLGHDYPGGTGPLADRLGIGRAVFNSKLNPNTMTHHLTLVESVRMQQLAGKATILHAMASELGYVVVPLIDQEDNNIPRALAASCGKFGDYLRSVDDSMADNVITPNERRELEHKLAGLTSANDHLQGLLNAKTQS